ncbi:antifreeze protein [Thalassococcus sp. S3]|uniref:antifreeze protein n=1 Tax=Thalassococcus sp. S3 TaxID=2017482 RepID=UPI001024152C|nr:antifreeze protein [Thalassococcus sp. S3]QBF32721.1 antifreeze protein [Thalassococcus sp. S3]
MHRSVSRATEMAQFWVTFAQLAIDAQTVVAMRMMGMGGAWSLPKSERHEMISEKAPAFTEAMVASALTAWAGGGPDRVMQAAIEPISKKARKNRTRLARRGPRRFGQADKS